MTTYKHSDACITAAVNGTCEHEATGFNNGYRKGFAEQAAKLDRDAADCPKCGGSSCSHSWEMETVVDPRDARIAELEVALRAFVDAETNENYGYATKADAIMRAVILARRALNPSIELNLGDKEQQ